MKDKMLYKILKIESEDKNGITRRYAKVQHMDAEGRVSISRFPVNKDRVGNFWFCIPDSFGADKKVYINDIDHIT